MKTLLQMGAVLCSPRLRGCLAETDLTELSHQAGSCEPINWDTVLLRRDRER